MTTMISIHSYRGGTGKSNLVANLATSLVLQGRRVAILDADIQSPGIHLLFGLDETQIKLTLNDYLWGRCPLSEVVYDVSPVLDPAPAASNPASSASPTAQAVGDRARLYLVPSSMKATEIATVLSEGYDVELLYRGLNELRHLLALDYLLIDTHPGLSEETLLAIGLSHLILVVLRPDYQDYQGTAVFVEVARELDVSRMMLVMNKVLLEFDAQALQQQLETTYQVPVAGVLPVSTEMIRLGSQGIFCLRYPEALLTQEINRIVQKIQEVVDVQS
ncbi:MAG: MinD/ParA family protein [Cyanophyceae cyanobacterium]